MRSTWWAEEGASNWDAAHASTDNRRSAVSSVTQALARVVSPRRCRRTWTTAFAGSKGEAMLSASQTFVLHFHRPVRLAHGASATEGRVLRPSRSQSHAGLRTLGSRDELEPFVRALFGLDCSGMVDVEPARRKRERSAAFTEALADFAGRSPTVVLVVEISLVGPFFHRTDLSTLVQNGQPAAVSIHHRFARGRGRAAHCGPGPLHVASRADREAISGDACLAPGRWRCPGAAAPLCYWSKPKGIPLSRGAREPPHRVRDPGEAGGLVGTGAAPGAGDLPTTVQGVISAERRRPRAGGEGSLAASSVIGRRFSSQILEAIVDEAASLTPSLNELQEHDLIEQLETQSNAEYSFKHAVTQEVVYEGVLHRSAKPCTNRSGTSHRAPVSRQNRGPGGENLAFHVSAGRMTRQGR